MFNSTNKTENYFSKISSHRLVTKHISLPIVGVLEKYSTRSFKGYNIKRTMVTVFG